MLFNSWAFVLLMVVTMAIYYLPIRVRWWQGFVILVASIVFYGYYSIGGLALLLIVALLNSIAMWSIFQHKENQKISKFIATTGVILDLLILAFFKYVHLLEFTQFGQDDGIGATLVHLALPLGISFYIFSAISLMIDTYRVSDEADSRISSCLKQGFVYLLFFPKVTQGPIVRSEQFLSQIDSRKKFADINWETVFKTLVLGYFLKMVIADNLKDFTFWMQSYNSFGPLSLLSFVFGYSIQLFADFAGYSLVAIGIAALLGYKLPQNFNFPYVASSFKNFWKRWHITLSEFLMKYLYFGLGGSKKGKTRTYLNLILTMTLGSIWHGAGISYLLWGFLHGVALAIERFIMGDKLKNEQSWNTSFRLGYTLFVFVCVSFLWLFFVLPDFSQFMGYLKCLVDFNRGVALVDIKKVAPLFVYALPVVSWHILYLCKDRKIGIIVHKFDYIWYGIMLFFIATNSGTSSQFIYVQF